MEAKEEEVDFGAAPSAASKPAPKKRNRGKPTWADMVEKENEKEKEGEKEKGGEKEKEKDRGEEEEWWQKDWKKRNQSWEEWWQEKEQEWKDWKEEMAEEKRQEEERNREEEKELKKWEEMGWLLPDPAKKEKEEGKEQEKRKEEEGKGKASKKWPKKNGSAKERGKMRWLDHQTAGQDPKEVELLKLGALGQSRATRLLTRQQDRQTFKEMVRSSEAAASHAQAAAESNFAMMQWMHQQSWQQSWSQQAAGSWSHQAAGGEVSTSFFPWSALFFPMIHLFS